MKRIPVRAFLWKLTLPNGKRPCRIQVSGCRCRICICPVKLCRKMWNSVCRSRASSDNRRKQLLTTNRPLPWGCSAILKVCTKRAAWGIRPSAVSPAGPHLALLLRKSLPGISAWRQTAVYIFLSISSVSRWFGLKARLRNTKFTNIYALYVYFFSF